MRSSSRQRRAGAPPAPLLGLLALAWALALPAPVAARDRGSDKAPGGATLESLAVRVAVEADPEAGARRMRGALRRLEADARRALESAAGPDEKRARFGRFFFEEAGFDGEADLAQPDGLLLHRVLERRRGTCVGLAQVYLILAERLGLPVRAAATPAHLFARWTEGDGRVNVELLEKGRSYSDDEYRSRQPLREPDPGRPAFLRDLGPEEVAARLYNNRGVMRSRAGRLAEAEADYARALELDPRFSAPHYNRGLDRLGSGRPREALADLEAALAIHPADAWALNNRGLARLALGERTAAESDFLQALAIDSSLAAARDNLQRVRSAAE